MGRVLLRIFTRRALGLTVFLALVLTLTWNSDRPLPLHGRSCFSNRGNPYGVKKPFPQNPEFLSELWGSLRAIFDAHPPQPAYIKPPKHEGWPNQDNLGGFFSLTDGDASNTRVTHEMLLAKLPPYPTRRFKGRGVVVLAGGKYSEYAATTVGLLREVGSKLPVEIWSKNHTEEMKEWCEEVQEEGMSCKRLADYMDTDVLKNAYQFKVLTMLFSTFSDVLFLDADSMPIRNPDPVFDSKVYKKNGVILWSDYWKHTGSPWLPYLIGLSEEPSSDMLLGEMSIESGQIYWNKQTHWKSLVLATYYNYFGADYWWTIFNNGFDGWGDKDTFVMACKALNEPYYQVKQPLVTTFVTGTDHGIGMMQANPTSEDKYEPLFMHSNIVKWSMRELVCETCEPMPNYKGKPFHMTNEKSPIITHLHDGTRIFATDLLWKNGVDPEPLLWRAIEHTACRSVWSTEETCKNARQHMRNTFGYRFTKDGESNVYELGHGVCIEGPFLNQDPE